jgi:2-dehydro-3-deoxyphosphogluconate aldolase / (4S)-4-hydroxy-2-oxoglutarate aldolase
VNEFGIATKRKTMPSAHPLFSALAQIRLLPALILDDVGLAKDVGQALKAGDLPCVEVTLRTPNALKVISALADDKEMWLGAGTVLNVDQAKAAMDAGATYLVSPGLNPRLAEFAQKQQIALIPGAVTGSEIMLALELGCPIVKFFPCESMGGLKAMQALAGPLPQIRFVPTGGVNAQNLGAYLEYPKIVAAGGSWMVAPNLLKNRDFKEITRLSQEARDLARQVKAPEMLEF